MVVTKIYTEPQICKKEILRYAGCKGTTDELLQFLLDECLEEVLPKLSYKVCYMELPISIVENTCDFGCMQIQSKDLVKNLNGCEKVLLFAATIGVEIDRAIAKYAHVSPTKAVLMQAIGAERIEALCDMFCQEVQNEIKMQGKKNAAIRPRFSPGYGDLPLETQTKILTILHGFKTIGVSLNDSLLMSPSKSVTAFVGVDISGQEKKNKRHSCSTCEKTDCVYRR